MLDRLLFILTQKLALLFVASLSVAGGFLATSSGHNADEAQTAIVARNVATSPAIFLLSLPDVPSGLLPATTLPFCTASSTCGRKGLQALLRIVKKPTAVATTVIKIAPIPVKISLPTTTPIRASSTLPITAQSLMANAKLEFKELRNGPYAVIVSAAGPNGETISWNIGAQTVGGPKILPQFTNSYSCTPTADMPASDALDQNPLFKTNTAYKCTVSLTPVMGDDRRAQSKDFSFITPAGQLFVTRATTMNTVLTNETNNGGIVFDNQDGSPVTVTGLTFDVSYENLTTIDRPLVFRLLNPATGQSLFDYHLESAPVHTGITAPVSFMIPAESQKMLPVQVLGVEKMLVASTSPSIRIVLRSVTTNRGEVKANLSSPQVSWSCVVSLASYDPNATTGAFATGQACRN